jgi:hypothetical protein
LVQNSLSSKEVARKEINHQMPVSIWLHSLKMFRSFLNGSQFATNATNTKIFLVVFILLILDIRSFKYFLKNNDDKRKSPNRVT